MITLFKFSDMNSKLNTPGIYFMVSYFEAEDF